MLQYRDLELKADNVISDGPNVYIDAYASVFGNVDTYNDVVVKGAFAQSITSESKRRIKFCYQHNLADVRGKIVEMKEDDYGLRIRVKLSRTAAGQDLAIQLMDGELSELSIGYITKNSDEIDGIRYLREVELIEVSVVSRAANPKAVVVAAERKDELITALDQLSDKDLSELKTAIDKEFNKRVINLILTK